MSSYERPTLPSLRTLNLLPKRGDSQQHDSHDRMPRRMHVPQHSWSTMNKHRRVSISSSATSSDSRSPSPSPSDASSLGATIPPSPFSEFPSSSAAFKCTLYPCDLAVADAVFLVAPATPDSAKPASSWICTGNAVKDLRERRTKLASGVRVHPYRFTPASTTRRSSNGSPV